MSIRDTKQAKRLIEAMAPEGEFLAFINEREAQMLRDAGGSGIMTLAGIPSFVDFGGAGTGYGSASDTFSSAGGGGGASGGGGGDDQEDDNARMMQAMGLTRGPTVATGEDQEDDNARMMQALGIPPGVTFSGTSNFAAPPQRLPDAKTLVTNLGLFLLGKDRPEVRAAIETIRGGKRIIDAFKNPDLGLNLTRAEKSRQVELKTRKENADALGIPFTEKDQAELDALNQKEAEENK